MRTYGFVGLGLMGGSFAKAIKNCADAASPFLQEPIKLLGCDSNSTVLEQAKIDGLLYETFLPQNVSEMLADCDVVIISLYPKLVAKFLRENEQHFKKGAIITDIAGTKQPLLEDLNFLSRDDIDFIPGHPMAGSEKEGYLHSSADIFKGRNYILVPTKKNKQENINFIRKLAYAIGFKNVIETDAKSHDHKIAFTSQLCHVIASALVDSAEDTGITAFGGGSYEDLTRIAMINAPLWTELFMENKTELLFHIEKFEESMMRFKKSLVENDVEQIESTLVRVREKRIAMKSS